MKLRIGIFALLFLAVTSPAIAQQKVRLNWGAISGVMSAIWVAQEEGLFKKYGLDVELIHIASTSRAIQSMLSGEIQYTTADALNSIQAVGAGADVVMVCEGVNRFVFSIMARPEIKRLADLKGKKIGITRIGSSTHTAVLFAVNKAGLADQRLFFAAVGRSAEHSDDFAGGPDRRRRVVAADQQPGEKGRAVSSCSISAPTGRNILPPSSPAPRPMSKPIRKIPGAWCAPWPRAWHIFKNNRQIGIRALQKYTRLKDSGYFGRHLHAVSRRVRR